MKEDNERDEPELRTARNKSLLAGHPTRRFGGSLGEHLLLTLEEIQEFIRWTYSFDGNALEVLREYFPDFEWKYFVPKREEVEKLVSESDYAFLKRPQTDYSLGVVTARRKAGGLPMATCFVWYNPGEKDWNWMGWPDFIQQNSSIKIYSKEKPEE